MAMSFGAAGVAGTSAKNMPLTGAATDLGLGDQLRQQAEDETEARKKKLSQLASSGMGVGALGSLASRDLFGSMR